MVKKTRAKSKKPSSRKQGQLGSLANEIENEKIEQIPAPIFVERAYLDYAMTVILNRALPVLGDGLKPVQRRIVYAMSELGLSAQSKPKKSARTVGDVIGKFHPHGDSACYEAMVLMAQPFSYRYPLIDGHGNWGSIDDPKSFAAMRYTESRLTPYAKTLTEELEQGTTSWRPNFDNTLKEPTCLPAKLPNMLLNGASGIAVGMSTDIPPHNLREVLKACIALLDRARLSDDELFALVPGPDFPGGGVICSDVKAIQDAYLSGNGNIRVRAEYEIIGGDIVITSMPYQVSTVRVVEQIATQIRNKKLPFVRNLRDESTEGDPVRIVIKPKGGKVSAEDLMSHLFATTDLERLYRINLNVIDQSGRPVVMSLKTMLKEWLAFRTATVKSRLSWRLEQIEARLEELAGFLIAYAHIDEVIRIIREADEPQPELMKRFKLNERQAHAILELKLRRLAKLEYIKVKDEQGALQKEKKEIVKILGSDARLKTVIKKELKACIEAHGDERRTQITADAVGATALKLEDLSTAEAMSVIVSRNGWVRAVKGHDIDPHGLSYQSGDEFLSMTRTNSKAHVAIFDAGGQCFCAAVASLPSGKGYGEPLSSRFALSTAVVAVVGDDSGDELLLVSSVGDALRVARSALNNTTRNGKKVVNVADGVTLAVVTAAPKDSLAVAVLNSGRMLAVQAEELPVLARGKGVRLIKVKADEKEEVASAACVCAGQTLLLSAGGKKRFSHDELAEQYLARRGTRGTSLKRINKKARFSLTVEGNAA